MKNEAKHFTTKKNDVVFKALFSRGNQDNKAMLEAILKDKNDKQS